jgi:cephalosporin-C deacetylase
MATQTQARKPAHEYQVDVERPTDFDTFWNELKERVAGVPLDPHMRPEPMRSTDEVEVFEIHYTSIDGVRIAGWYCRPRESFLPPPYPGLLLVPGYISEPTLPKSWAKLGYATIGVAPRGKLRSNSQFNPGYPGLLTHNIIDRNTYSYRGFYIDAIRAVDFALSRPEIDRERIGVHGSSQGGALTVVTSALRNDVIACGAAGAPYLAGFMDAAKLTHSNPYEEINDYLRMHPDHRDLVTETVAYFDCINFAPLISCPMLVYIGLEDDVCPPETGYALVGAMKNCEVTLHAAEHCAHDAGAYWEMPQVEAFLASHLLPAGSGRPETTVG